MNDTDSVDKNALRASGAGWGARCEHCGCSMNVHYRAKWDEYLCRDCFWDVLYELDQMARDQRETVARPHDLQ